MISSRQELKYYIKEDLIAHNIHTITLKMQLKSLFCPTVWKYQIMLRHLEYLEGKHWGGAFRSLKNLMLVIGRVRLQRYGLKLGFTIPTNVFGPGLCICHAGTIVVNEHSRIGANVRIHVGVNIGNYSLFDENWRADNTPTIGNNVYIGPGVKIYGKISIGNDVAIGANSVVNKDIPDHVTVAGIPAKIINNNGSEGMIVKRRNG